MSTADAGGKAKLPKSRSEKKSKSLKVEQHPADKLKTVIRRLPPNLPEEIFWQSVQPWVSDETVSWKTFYQGKIRKKYNKENIPSRAYIAFRDVNQLSTFSQAYDGHRFQDKSGNEFAAVVEFAPSPKIPPERKKADPRAGTIEQEIDEDYISFINSLNAPPSKPTESDTIEALIAASKPPPEPETTPLLEALRADKQAQRDRETILKAHAHYQRGDVDGTGTSGRRRGGKAIAVPPPQADKDDGGATGSGGKRRRGKKGEGKERGKEREQAPPSAKGVGKGGPKTISTAVPASTKDKDVSKDKEGPKEKEKPARALLQMALSGAGIRRGDKKSTAAVPASGLESSGKLAIPAAAAATILQAGTEKDKTKEKPESGQGQPLTSPGRERGRGGRRRGDSAKSPSRVVKQAQAITPGQGGSTGSAPTILPRPPGAPSILQRPTDGTSPSTAAATPGGSDGRTGTGGSKPEGGGGRGGRRRGRGRGGGGGGGNPTRGGAPGAGPVSVGAGAPA